MKKSYYLSGRRSIRSWALLVGTVTLSAAFSLPALAAPPTLTCESDANIFNTGYDGAGGKLSPGAVDAHWEAGLGNASGPGSVTTWTAANVVGNLAPGAWINSPFSNSEWVARGNGLGDGGGAIVYYRYLFNIDAAVPLNSFALQFDFYIDDHVQQIAVNGAEYKSYTSVDANGEGGFTASGKISENLVNGAGLAWQTGPNSIVIKSWNNVAPTGFLAQIKANSTCPPQVTISKTASNSGAVTRGSTINYTVSASNTGAVSANGAVVSDPLPTGISFASWVCTASGGAVCPASSGTLSLNHTIATFPAGGKVTYAITARVADDAPEAITNAATIQLPDALTVPPDGTSSVTNPVSDPAPVPQAVPTLSQWALLFGSLGMATLGFIAIRRRNL